MESIHIFIPTNSSKNPPYQDLSEDPHSVSCELGSEFVMETAAFWEHPGLAPRSRQLGRTRWTSTRFLPLGSAVIRTVSKSTYHQSLTSWIQSLETMEKGKDWFLKNCSLTSTLTLRHVCTYTHTCTSHRHNVINKDFFFKSQKLGFFFFFFHT